MAQRQSPRRLFRRKAGILISGAYQICDALQIGEGGMLIRCGLDLQVGQLIVMSFIVPNRANVVVRAEIRYREAENFGLQFIGLSFEAKRAIRYYVAAQAQTDVDALSFTLPAEKPGLKAG